MKTKNMFKTLLAVGLMSTVLASCDSDVFNVNSDPFKGQTYLTDTSSPISIILEGNPNFSEYVEALRYSGTYNALNQSTTGVSFTAFVPDNDAMKEFYTRRGVNSLHDFTPEYVRSFVLYHTKGDSISTENFITSAEITNLIGDRLKIVIDPYNAGEAELGEEGHITEMGISAYNGNIYVLSRALTPLVESVYDRVAESGTSAIMTEAIEAAGMTKDLKTVADTITENGIKNIVNRYYTMLNVSDATFAKAGINSLADLRAKLQARNERTDVTADSLLKEYVAYHVVKGTYALKDFGDPDVLVDEEANEIPTFTTKLLGTNAKNQAMMLDIQPVYSDMAGKYTFNSDDAGGAKVDEAESNLRATNGYVHFIDSWMPVWEPKPTTVVWDLTDDPLVRSIVTSYDPTIYQVAEPLSTQKSVPIDKATSFETDKCSISYQTFEGASNMRAVHNDCLSLRMEYMGSLQMHTPTIVRGKYRVEISLGYDNQVHRDFRDLGGGSNGGIIKVVLDDKYNAFSQLYPTAPNNRTFNRDGGVISGELYEEVEFEDTADHLVKIVFMDPYGNKNPYYIDCITFTPITE